MLTVDYEEYLHSKQLCIYIYIYTCLLMYKKIYTLHISTGIHVLMITMGTFFYVFGKKKYKYLHIYIYVYYMIMYLYINTCGSLYTNECYRFSLPLQPAPKFDQVH